MSDRFLFKRWLNCSDWDANQIPLKTTTQCDQKGCFVKAQNNKHVQMKFLVMRVGLCKSTQGPKLKAKTEAPHTGVLWEHRSMATRAR